MKIAVVYNRDSQNVINLFGIPNRERIGRKTIKRISDALKAGKHQVKEIEGDKDLIERLGDFMPKVLKGELPGLVFNVSYGIQGQARYAHVPSILEMIGIPYVGSGPLAHGLALDKVVAKIIFRQHNLPTPEFVVLNSWEDELPPDLPYPMVVKPKNESVSFGVTVVHSESELREAVRTIFEAFKQPVLAEQYIEGREINVGLIGNNPAEVLPPVELLFPKDGPAIYTYQDKVHKSGREIGFECPAKVSQETLEKAQDLARRAFEVLGCFDCARVDMRLDAEENLHLLEVNSLPSMGEHGSYTIGAQNVGLDFPGLVNRLVEVASTRYFGTPKPVRISKKTSDTGQLVMSFLTQRRDQIERRLRVWTNLHSRTSDPFGIQQAKVKLSQSLEEIGLEAVEELTDNKTAWTWQTKAGVSDGTLFVGHLDVALTSEIPIQVFRRTPEWLYGEGIGLSRAPLVMLEFVLKVLKSLRKLNSLPVGVLYYADEGRDNIESSDIIKAAAERAKRVLILRPGNPQNKVVIERRGWRKYQLVAEDVPSRLGKARKKPEILRWVCNKLEDISKLSSKEKRLSIAVSDIRPTTFPMLLPHKVEATILLSYGDKEVADDTEPSIREMLVENGFRCQLKIVSDRPAMKNCPANKRLVGELAEVAANWEIPFGKESSLWPSVAGLVPSSTPVVCGLGPVTKDVYTPNEAVERISLLQRTLLVAEFLAKQAEG
ncbi:MAG: ATP-grasp domain-containing protein [Sedimentisphaerales bacterium]|nr:ATP-grasp domain-containing protein [Sedimentisphaerales bacterium]